MSHFLGTPSHSRVWALKHSEYVNVLEHAKASRQRLLSGPTVDIYVGSEQKHWSLHRNLLCHHSSYFETELQGHEVPKREQMLSHYLPDDDPRGFELLVKWLYQGHLDESSHMTEEAKYDYAVACHKLYQLCDRFDMIQLKNLAMDAYRQNLHAAELVPDADEINEIYSASPTGSPFRKLMVKIAARQIMDPDVDRDAESYRACLQNNPDFAIDMIKSIRQTSGGILFDDPTEKENCEEWHDHRDGSDCGGKLGTPDLKSAIVNQNIPNSAVKMSPLRPPLAELSEQPTPRIANNANTTTPVAKQPLARRTPLPGRSPRKLAFRESPRPPGRQRKLEHRAVSDGAGFNQDARGSAARRSASTNVSQRSLVSSAQHVSTKIPNGTPVKQSAALNGVLVAGTPGRSRAQPERATSDAASSFASGPRKSNRVNGIVHQLNGASERSRSSRPSSVAGTSDAMSRKSPPPKLKRKAPG